MSHVNDSEAGPDSVVGFAVSQNAAFIKRTEKRATAPDAVSRRCLESYQERLAIGGDSHPLHDLTRHLVGTAEETAADIRTRMEEKWAGYPDASRRVESSVTNSLRRSAGTNYQTLVSYALARYLLEAGSAWYVVHPVPTKWAHALSIRFTAGVTLEDSPIGASEPSEDASGGEAEPPGVKVKPDLDILIRNASWPPSATGNEPVLVLSVKTSLADRAGAAARWKTYFDLVTHPCPNLCEESCAYRRLGIQLAHSPAVDITHGIVTANIYKINSDPHFTRYGELRSNQSRSNTFMFDLRFTTREESDDVMAEGWVSLSEVTGWLAATAAEHGLEN